MSLFKKNAASRAKPSKRAFGLRRRGAFYADMAAFLDAGIPPYQALTEMEAVARKRRSTAGLGRIFAAVLQSLQLGNNLSTSLARWVPGNEAVMLVGAENAGSGVLQLAFSEMSQLLDRQQKAKAKLVGALVSGGMSIGVIIGVITLIMVVVVPQLTAAMTKDMEVRMMFAPAYFAFGRLFLKYGAFFGLLCVALTALVVWSLPRWVKNSKYLSRRWFDQHLMPWTLYLRTQCTFFLASAAAMMRAGIPLKVVASDMAPYASPWTRYHLRRILADLNMGRSEVYALGGGMLPTDSSDRLRVYQLMPDFTGIMTRLAADNFESFERSIDRISKALGLISLLLLSTFLVCTLFAVFDYANAVQQSVTAARAAAGG